MPDNCIYSYKTDENPKILLNPDADAWKNSTQPALISLLWNGKAPLTSGRKVGASVASLWNEKGIFFHFRCGYDKLHVNRDYPSDSSVEGLWDFDVAEVFIKPAGCRGYFEYEVSPLAQYLAAHIIEPWKNVDFTWDSKMKARSELNEKSTTWNAVIKLPFKQMDNAEPFKKPEAGDIWRANLLLALGADPTRNYMCWQPTLTEDPNFHVPDAFGCLIFRN
jgi:alpha-galactosidase